jgi:hypothetical protein
MEGAPVFNCCYQALAQIEGSGEQAPKPVIDRLLEILLASQVTLGRQNRSVAEKKLNLLQLASVDVT